MRAYSRSEVLEAVRRAVRAGGRVPTTQEFSRATGVSMAPVIRIFGSWDGALRAAGVDVVSLPRWTRESALEAARKIVRPGEPIGIERFFADAPFSRDTAARLFGSWDSLRAECGGRPPRRRRITREQVVGQFRAFAAERGDGSFDEFFAWGGPSMTPVRRLFGSVGGLREAAGLPRRYAGVDRSHKADDLADEWLRLRRRLGREPTCGDIETYGRFPWAAYARRWRDAAGVKKAMRRAGRELAEAGRIIKEVQARQARGEAVDPAEIPPMPTTPTPRRPRRG